MSRERGRDSADIFIACENMRFSSLFAAGGRGSDSADIFKFLCSLASHADVLRGSSRVPAPRTSAEQKDKFLSHCLQISAGDHMQIIGDPIQSVDKPNKYAQAP